MTDQISNKLNYRRKLLASVRTVLIAITIVAGVMNSTFSEAQSPTTALHGQEFDVATIKPSAPPTVTYTIGGVAYAPKSFRFRPGGGLQTTGSTLRDLVTLAYDLLPNQIQGDPPWAAVDRYDVTANVTEGEGDPATLTPAQKIRTGIRPRIRPR
jgi:hypothetical protein